MAIFPTQDFIPPRTELALKNIVRLLAAIPCVTSAATNMTTGSAVVICDASCVCGYATSRAILKR